MKLALNILIVLCLSVTTSIVTAQSNHNVGLIGSNPKKYEGANLLYKTQLLEVCNNNLDSAYQTWVTVLHDIEKFAESSGFDVKGLKLWIHVFVQNDRIKELYFHPKPNSRNTDFGKVEEFFEKFISVYHFPTYSDTKFNHYGSASFPVFSVKVNVNEK